MKRKLTTAIATILILSLFAGTLASASTEPYSDDWSQAFWFRDDSHLEGSTRVYFNFTYVYVNGGTFLPWSNDIVIANGRTFMPARAVAELTGANVHWCGDSSVVSITSPKERYVKEPTPFRPPLWRGTWDQRAYIRSVPHVSIEIDGYTVELPNDSKPILNVNTDRILLPMRVIAETFDMEIVWEMFRENESIPATSIIFITYS